MAEDIRDNDEEAGEEVILENEFDCLLCGIQRRNNRLYPPQIEITATTPKIQLQCGHIFHTHCFIKQLMFSEMEAVDQHCPHETCNEQIVGEETIRFYRGNRNRYDGARNLIQLWNTNEEFRAELKEVFRLRSIYINAQKMYSPKRKLILGRYKEIVKPFVEAIRYERKEFSTDLYSLPEAKKSFRAATKYHKYLSAFLHKYHIWSGDLRVLRGIKGTPRIPLRSINVPYNHRFRSRRRLFRIGV
jgi:hypothetical protein